jgi:hypothetical protein
MDADEDGYPLIERQLCVIDCDLPEPVLRVRHAALWNYLETAATLELSSGMLPRAADAAKAVGVRVDWIHSNAAQFLTAKRYDAAICLCEGAFGLLGQGDDPIDQPLDPLTMVESSKHSPREGLPAVAVRERAFVPTELLLLFRLAGMSVLNLWGGTAGNWGRRTLDLDEIEIMIVACKTAEPSAADDA